MVIFSDASPSQPLFVFAGGGTGGHLYPALAIASELRARIPGAKFLFCGTRRSIDQRVLGGVDCDVIQQPLVPLHRAPWRWPKILSGFRRSRLMCRSQFERNPPAIVVGTGGLACVPAVREALRLGIPTALLNPDALPGRANRYLARSVDAVFVQWPETVDHLPRGTQVVVTGCPVRRSVLNATRANGIERFGLDSNLKTLLVTGASQGARSINQAVVKNLDYLDSRPNWQVLHLTGEDDHGTVCEAYLGRTVRACVLTYTEYMAEALAAADLVVARAGASSLAEITAVGRPAILMPYPYHKDQHQLANARCLTPSDGGPAARVLEDRIDPSLNGPALRSILRQLMSDDDLRTKMAQAALRIGNREASSLVADQLVNMPHGNRALAESECLEAIG